MSYLVIARKFRPQSFASVIGQDHITKALANAILWNRVPHALLFTGPRGVGKTTSARVLAKALNCNGRQLPVKSEISETANSAELIEPCGKCINCKEITKSTSLAVWEIDGASNNSVENVRELIDSLYSVPPPGSKYKIYIIDEVHMLSTAAFNALLKSLEEPPPNTIFIFATTEPHKIPETVISRCQRHDFRKISTDVIAQSLEEIAKEEGIKAEPGVFDFVARKAQGGMRDAQSLLDRLISFSGNKLELETAQQIFGAVDNSYYIELSNAILGKNNKECLFLINKAFSQSLDIKSYISDFVTHFRRLLVLSLLAAKNSNLTADKEILNLLEINTKEFSELLLQVKETKSFDFQRLFDLALETAQTALSCNFSRFALEAGIAKMATLADLMPIADILSSLKGNTSISQAQTIPTTKTLLTENTFKTETPIREIPAEIILENEVTFNPSWHDFVLHVQSFRKEILLATLLKRSFALIFTENKLSLEGSDFDISTLQDHDTLTILNSCLQSYSGHGNWEIRFQKQITNKPLPTQAATKAGLNSQIEKQKITSPLHPSSISGKEVEAEQKKHTQMQQEARSNPLVQSVLDAFGGSQVEKVSIIKK